MFEFYLQKSCLWELNEIYIYETILSTVELYKQWFISINF